MKVRFFERGPTRRWPILLVFAILSVASLLQFKHTGDDLAVSYIGCRLVASGNALQLYTYSPGVFADIGEQDSAWKAAAAEGKFTGFLHPYVQTPLWAYALRPLCMGMPFRAFRFVFAGLTLLCFGGSLWIIAARWAPDLLNPYAMGTICVGLFFSEPFRYAMFLMQTHVLFFFLTLAALILAERRPGWAGLLLAVAAAVKITPGFLLIYWLLTRRWRAAASLAGWSAVLGSLTIMVAGKGLVLEYLADLHRIAQTLLVSLNNQSFAAWCMGRFYPSDELYDLQIFPLPAAVRLGSMSLLLLCTVAGGWLDRRRGETAIPLGAMVALVGATLFSPIAWTHYFIVLLAPIMLLLQENRTLRSKALWVGIGLLVALNFQPLAPGMVDSDVYAWTLVRSHFYSGVVCLAMLGYAAWLGRQTVEREVEVQRNVEVAAA